MRRTSSGGVSGDARTSVPQSPSSQSTIPPVGANEPGSRGPGAPASLNKAGLRAALLFQERIKNAANAAARGTSADAMSAFGAPPPIHSFAYEPKGHTVPSYTGTKP